MKRRSFVAVSLCIATLAIGPAPGHAQDALEKPKITIAVGGKTLFYYLPLTIAERLGYFRDAGLSVEISDFPGGAKALQALVGGSVDMVSGSFEHTINMQAKGIAIEAVVLQGRYPGIVLGLKKDKAATYKSGKDLKGLKIGVTAPGSSTNMFVSHLLAKDGLPPDALSIIGVGAGASAVAAMKKGEIDGIANLDPVIHRLEAAGDIVSVVDTRTASGSQAVYGGVYPAGSIYVPIAFVKKNPNTTQALVNAMVRALLWIQKATPDQIVGAVPAEYYGSDKAVYKAALEKNLAAFSPDGLVPPQGVKNVYAVLNAFEASVKEAKIDPGKTFDNSFVQKALARYQ